MTKPVFCPGENHEIQSARSNAGTLELVALTKSSKPGGISISVRVGCSVGSGVGYGVVVGHGVLDGVGVSPNVGGPEPSSNVGAIVNV